MSNFDLILFGGGTLPITQKGGRLKTSLRPSEKEVSRL